MRVEAVRHGGRGDGGDDARAGGAEPRARAETSLPRVHRVAPGGGDADGRVQTHGAVVPAAGERAAPNGGVARVAAAAGGCRGGGQLAPRARRRRGHRARIRVVAGPSRGGGGDGRPGGWDRRGQDIDGWGRGGAPRRGCTGASRTRGVRLAAAISRAASSRANRRRARRRRARSLCGCPCRGGDPRGPSAPRDDRARGVRGAQGVRRGEQHHPHGGCHRRHPQAQAVNGERGEVGHVFLARLG
mmetsp:Transcript_5859/g.26354  ORF Transcript_5859/g.26354 Transcript_5859/m.26354 type:complete len:244 (-) Transcript_5859:1138-1869(-)